MSIACFLAEGDGTGRTLVAVNMCLPQQKGRFVDHNPVKQFLIISLYQGRYLFVQVLTQPRAILFSITKITAIPLLQRKTFMAESLV